MHRRKFLQLLGASGVSAVAGSSRPRSGQAASGRQQPNFLIIMSDEQSPHILGCYGDPVVKTPHLDALAKRGVVFESAYCTAPTCVPSRMGFLTARHPFQIRVWENDDILSSEVSTWAHVLGGAGYETALIGRMHFNGYDQWHGFEKLLMGTINSPLPNRKWPLPPDLMVGAGCDSRAAVELAGPGRTAYQVYDEQVAEAAVQYLRRKGHDGDRPFAAVVGLVLPHPPYICPKDQWLYYRDRVTVPSVPAGYFDQLHPVVRRWRKARGLEDLPDEVVRKARAGYYGLVTRHDSLIGKVLQALEDNPRLKERTVVVYVSDHGEMAGENGMWWKTNFYEGSVSVPLIVAWPERFRPAQRRKEVVSLIDIGPTLVELAQAPSWEAAAGRSFVPLLADKPVNWANEAFSELLPYMGQPLTRMVRSGKWKLVHFDGMAPQLFNLETDPHEFRDLGQDSTYAQVRKELLRRVLRGWSAELVKQELGKRSRD